ncbi:TPA: hypothetical protein ACONM6_002589 [Staphylococcus aureus]
MTLFIIIGVLVPMVYTMQLNIKNEPVTKRNLLITLAFTGIVWGLLLSGSYALIRFLSNAFGRK